MPGLPFFDEAAPAPVRTPKVEITVGGGGESSGFGGLADAAASLLGAPAGPSWADYLQSLSLQQGFAPQVDVLEMIVANTSDAPQGALGDSVTVSMGAADALQQVFTGTITGIEQRSDGMRRYQASNGSQILAQARINQSVVNMNVQDAVSFAAGQFDYAPQADLSASDDTLAQIVFHDSASVWEHLAYLAGLRGANVWFDANDNLQLADQLEQGDSAATFTWGKDLLDANVWQRSAHSGAITAMGGARIDDGFVLRKQSSTNRSEQGDGKPQRFYRDGVLYSPNDLSTRASAAAMYGQRQTQASNVLVTGSGVAGPGKVIELAELPQSGSGKYVIHNTTHIYSKTMGWRTHIRLSPAGEGAGGLPGLGALGGLL